MGEDVPIEPIPRLGQEPFGDHQGLGLDRNYIPSSARVCKKASTLGCVRILGQILVKRAGAVQRRRSFCTAETQSAQSYNRISRVSDSALTVVGQLLVHCQETFLGIV